MPEDHLAYDFKRNTASACVGGGVASEIMRSQVYSNQIVSVTSFL